MKQWYKSLLLFLGLWYEGHTKNYEDRVMAVLPCRSVSSEVLEKLRRDFPKYDFSLCKFVPEGGNLQFYSKKSKAVRKDCVLSAINRNNTIIWMVRGGYGSARFLDQLPKKTHAQNIIIGFSDVTALLIYTADLYGWKNIHGAMLNNNLSRDKSEANILIIENYLKNGIVPKIDKIQPLNNRARDINHIKGLLTGGNMSIIQSSIGTFWQIDTKDKILILEDIGESPYVIDRILNHMKQANLFKHCKSIIFGSFEKCGRENGEMDVMLQEFADDIDIPVFKTDKFGHGEINIPFLFNRIYVLNRQESGFVLE